jgi:hypothetical protein
MKLLAVLVTILMAMSVVAAADPAPSNLVYVNIKEHKGDVQAHVGDLVEFAIRYPVVPNSIITDLKVEMTGTALSKVAVVKVPNLSPEGKPLIGVGIMSAFLKADKEGEATVKITPNDKEAKTVEFKVKVSVRK